LRHPARLWVIGLIFCGGIGVSAQQGTLNLTATQGPPGSTISIPVNLTLNHGISIDSLAFGVSITPGAGAPAIAGQLTFQPAAGLPTPSPVFYGTNPVSIGPSFLGSLSLSSGTVFLGNIVAVIPASASIGQNYTAAFTASTASASHGGNGISVFTGPSVQIPVEYFYLVGDAYPYTGDAVGSFGDGVLNTLDLITALRAVTSLPGYLPATCSDRYDAMDSYPVDTATQRGGDTYLNTLDLIETLQRITALDTSRPVRTPRGSCPTSAATPDAVRRGVAVESMWFGEAQTLEGGVVRVPVYLRAERGLDLAGLSFGVGWQGSGVSVQFVPGDIGGPTLVDSGEPGALALAWLNDLPVLKDNVLVGYLQASGVDPATGFAPVFYGVDAIRRGDRAADNNP
jgi:hypothetical protein